LRYVHCDLGWWSLDLRATRGSPARARVPLARRIVGQRPSPRGRSRLTLASSDAERTGTQFGRSSLPRRGPRTSSAAKEPRGKQPRVAPRCLYPPGARWRNFDTSVVRAQQRSASWRAGSRGDAGFREESVGQWASGGSGGHFVEGGSQLSSNLGAKALMMGSSAWFDA
jgi:hypothetical protein